MHVEWFDREWMLKSQLTEHERLRNAGRLVAVVFHRDGERIRNFRRAWLSACQAASVPGRILHNFRRTAVRKSRAGRRLTVRRDGDGRAQDREHLPAIRHRRREGATRGCRENR